MNEWQPETRGVVVKILVRRIGNNQNECDVARDIYLAAIAALGSRFAVMGYSWDKDEDAK